MDKLTTTLVLILLINGLLPSCSSKSGPREIKRSVEVESLANTHDRAKVASLPVPTLPNKGDDSPDFKYKLDIGDNIRDKLDPVKYALKIVARPKMSEKTFFSQSQLIHRQAMKLAGKTYFSPDGRQQWHITAEQYIVEVLPHVWANKIIALEYSHVSIEERNEIKNKLLIKVDSALDKLSSIKRICGEIYHINQRDYTGLTLLESERKVTALIKDRQQVKGLLVLAFDDYPYVTYPDNINRVIEYYQDSQCFDENWDKQIEHAKKYLITKRQEDKAQREKQIRFNRKKTAALNRQKQKNAALMADAQVQKIKRKLKATMNRLKKAGAKGPGKGTIDSVITAISHWERSITEFIGYAYPLGQFYSANQVLGKKLVLSFNNNMPLMIKTRRVAKKGKVFNQHRYFIVEGMSKYRTRVGSNNALLLLETDVVAQ